MAFDSLMLVELLLEFEGVLEECGAASLVEEIDASLLQRLTIAEFSRLLDLLEDGSQPAIAACRSELRRARSDFESEIHARMRSDAQLSPLDLGHIEMEDEPVANVLLTGATGFFGPFLLSSLLRKTPYTYYVLTRATDSERAWERVRGALQRASVLTPSLDRELRRRVCVVCGDIVHDNLGLSPHGWESLTRQVHAVVHNAACVNYVLNYEALKPHNIDGTRNVLRFAHSARRKEVHFISSTFIFGWTVKGYLRETDNNDEMASLDFGYSQTKWVAEQLLLSAQAMGLKVRIYRPSLISASSNGVGDRNDVAIRLLAFMINHGIAIDTTNQVSILPADVAADNIAAIVGDRDVGAHTFHVTVDGYYNIMDLTRIIERQHGYAFTYYGIAGFIEEMNFRCTKSDPLYPLLSFFNRSASKIAAMQLKRYRNDQYQKARERLGIGRSDPTLEDTVSYMIACMLDQEMITPPVSR
jgi:thioester reductase-like protein